MNAPETITLLELRAILHAGRHAKVARQALLLVDELLAAESWEKMPPDTLSMKPYLKRHAISQGVIGSMTGSQWWVRRDPNPTSSGRLVD